MRRACSRTSQRDLAKFDVATEWLVPAQVKNNGVAAASKEDELREPVVDRDTVKRLSNLIITRENPKKGGGKKKRDE